MRENENLTKLDNISKHFSLNQSEFKQGGEWTQKQAKQVEERVEKMRDDVKKIIIKLNEKTQTGYMPSLERVKEIMRLTRDINRLVQKLNNTINRQSNIQGSRINHYTTNYNTVPLWVLMPQLDFGTTAYFFKCSQKDIQSKIAKNMKFEFIEENPEFNDKYIFTGEALSNIIFFVNSFRNICAHNERLYNHRFTANNINSFIIHEHYSLNFNYGLFDLILILKFFITQLEYRALKSLLTYSLAFLSLNVDESDFIKILNKMKFPKNWEEILEIKEDLQKAKEFYQNNVLLNKK